MALDSDQDDAELRAAERMVAQRRCRRPREKRMADVISRLLARSGYAQVDAGIQLANVWSKLVGPPISEHSRPAALKRGVLTVIARNSVTLQELTFRKRELIKNLQELDLGQEVRDLRFRVSSFD